MRPLTAYRRHLALHKWRQVMDAQASAGVSREQAIRQAGRFPGLGAYQDLWERWWDEQVTASVDAETPLLERVEAAVSGALHEEVATRRQRGDAPVEDVAVLQDVRRPGPGSPPGGGIRQPGDVVSGARHASGPRPGAVPADVLPPVREAVVEGTGGGLHCRAAGRQRRGAHRGRGGGAPADGQRLAGHRPLPRRPRARRRGGGIRATLSGAVSPRASGPTPPTT